MSESKIRNVRRSDFIGRRIVDVEMQRFDNSAQIGPSGRNELSFDAITLDNGRRIWFSALEAAAEGYVGASTTTIGAQPRGKS